MACTLLRSIPQKMLASIAAPLCARMLCICKTGRNETWHVVADVFVEKPHPLAEA